MSNHEKKACLLCQKECDTYRYAQSSNTEYLCDTCSHYAVNDFVDVSNFKLLSSMFYYLLHKRPQKDCVYFVSDETHFDDNEHVTYVGVKTLESIYPNNFSQRIDMTLMNLSKLCGGIGQRIEFLKTNGAPNFKLKIALFVDEDDLDKRNSEIAGVFSLLSEMGFVTPLNDTKSVLQNYKIAARGWLRIQELIAINKVIPQAFIAMWFDPQMDIARSKIIAAIQDNGYTPMIIDNKEHNNQIVPEILYEIKQSTFIISDLTGHRNGVYYEAGYAQALGKEVILTCKESDFDKRHFDVAQKNMIKWIDEEDLYIRLLKRIEATVGKNG